MGNATAMFFRAKADEYDDSTYKDMMDMADSIPDLKYKGWNDRAGAEERPSQPEMPTGIQEVKKVRVTRGMSR